ncbi:hypothetical protein XENTR_v10023149 [Xenopus tropicalis]|nr:hypothetical protein XENTR_v10023149 [Xenopus tropicalis]
MPPPTEILQPVGQRQAISASGQVRCCFLGFYALTHSCIHLYTLTAHNLAGFFSYLYTLTYTLSHNLYTCTHKHLGVFLLLFFSFYHFVFSFFYLKTIYFDSLTVGSDILATNYTVM